MAARHGGVLGEAAGLRTTLAVGAVTALAAATWLLLTPVRTFRELAPSTERRP